MDRRNTKKLEVRVPPSLQAAVESQARTELLSTSAYIRRTLAQALNSPQPQEVTLHAGF